MKFIRHAVSAFFAIVLLFVGNVADATTLNRTFVVVDNNAAFNAPRVIGDFFVRFSGADANMNGAIERTEVLTFQAFYSGFGTVDSMSFDISALDSFSYDISQADPVFLSLEVTQTGIFNSRTVNTYRVVSTIVRAEDEQQDFHSTNAFLIVAPIPVPGAWVLLASALGLLGFANHRRGRSLRQAGQDRVPSYG